jgi:DNA-binding transcriptional MerR regulator
MVNKKTLDLIVKLKDNDLSFREIEEILKDEKDPEIQKVSYRTCHRVYMKVRDGTVLSQSLVKYWPSKEIVLQRLRDYSGPHAGIQAYQRQLVRQKKESAPEAFRVFFLELLLHILLEK